MKRLARYLLLLPLLFSCSKVDLSKLYTEGNYQEVYDFSLSKIETKITDEPLYYLARSANKLGLQEDSVNAALLYTLLFSSESDERDSMLRIILHYGNNEDALNAGLELKEDNALTKDDSIQLYKVFNDNKMYSEANKFISQLYLKLSHSEYVFCLVNGGANIDRILTTLENYQMQSGTNEEFLSSIRLMLPTVDEEFEIERMSDFFERTFDGDTRYALLIGDFYFDIQNNEKTALYWKIAKKDFSEAIENREIVSGINID